MPGLHASGTAGLLASAELDRDIAGVQGTFGWSTQSGAVTFNASYTFNVAAVAAGDYTVNSVSGAAYAGGTVVLDAADPTNPRIDVVVITAAGAVSVVKGTPRGASLVYAAPTSGASPTTAVATTGPVPGALTTSQLEIARIYVPANNTPAMSATSITDRRVPLVSAPNVFDGIRTLFRANRRKVAEYAPAQLGADSTNTNLLQVTSGLGFSVYTAGTNSDTVAAISGEPYMKFGTGASGTKYGVGPFSTGTNLILALSPNHSPRMLMRVLLPAASANVTVWLAGFFDTAAAVTSEGAFLRIATTGNVFFVTDNGGTETATDLGALSRVAMLGFEIETADAGVTWVCRNQAGTVLATHTTNVPTVSAALVYGVSYTWATSTIPMGVAYARVEGTFA